MAITASDVKKLRDITGAGMMDCKKALNEANGDMAQAEKILKEMGLAAVAKRQDRATENGRVFVEAANGKAVLLELSCETDFVAKNDQFKALGEEMCRVILEKGYTEPNDELKGMVDGLIAIIKENMAIKRIRVISIPANGYAATYLHGEGSVAVVVGFESDNAAAFENDAVKEFTHDCALHVAAFKPQFLSTDSVTKEYEAEQLSIFRAQVAQMDKPEKVLEGIVRGKLNKLYSEVCFLNQPFVKDDSMSVSKKMAEVSKAAGAKLSIVSCDYFQAGVEG
ncbi:MAG: translation elongation factor Ts [Bullifex sp.]|nr:translation elongation factor Ts [Spirochaetales bacterium]MDY2816915.1 translation elongation factor Ts [Bullifex sp.]MDY3849904.1 translation elongation factor Ts [Bullifex sp.]MDY5908626.1 translation elongation factor Ts [Bullifex sp.]